MSFEFNLDSLKQAGSALKNIFDKKEEDPRTETEKLKDFQTAKEEYTPTEYQKQLGETEDARAAKESDIITGAEAIKKETQEKKDSEAELDKKLKNIEKVINTFGEFKQYPGTPLESGDGAGLNLKPLDLSSLMAKEYLSKYTAGMSGQNSSDQDRIALLYDRFKKTKRYKIRRKKWQARIFLQIAQLLKVLMLQFLVVL
jgi:hypothetical protein